MVIAVSCSVIYVRHSCRKVGNAAASYPGGMGGMEILKNHLEIAVDMAGRKLPKGEVYHSVDLDPTCQRVLLGHNPVHVFKDILQLLKLPVRIAVQRVMKEKEAHVQQLLAESQNSDTPKQKKQQLKSDLKEVGEGVLKSLMECMDQFSDKDFFQATAACYKHPDGAGSCQIFPDKVETLDGEGAGSKEYFMAGTSCTDWSSMGTMTSLAGSTVLPFAVELQIVKRRRPRVFFHECTRNFRPTILAQYLEGF